MPAARGTSTAFQGQIAPEDAWVNVTWMPHASISQTSHICLLIRSAHIWLDEVVDPKPQEWKVSASVYGLGDIPLVPVASTTPSKEVLPRKQEMHHEKNSFGLPNTSDASHDCRWDHLIQIPVRWRDLPRDSFLLLEIIDHTGTILSSTRMPFFTKYGQLRTGLTLLDLNNMYDQDSATLSSDRGWGQMDEDPVWKASKILDKLNSFDAARSGLLQPTATDTRKVFGQVQSVPWLDNISRDHCNTVIACARTSQDQITRPRNEQSFQLIVELPVFDVPVMHEESFYPVPQQAAAGAFSALDLSLYRKTSADSQQFHPLQLVSCVDYENEMDNPVEDKYRTLAHDLLRGLVDPALKPDREQRDRLAAIISDPSHHPTREEKDLLWRFRFSLVDNHRALTKFLLAVDWTVESEVVQAAELLEQWRRLDIPDALKLLGKHVAFQTNLVKNYAIETLATAPDTELRLYLLQLVQAIKYETMPGNDTRSTRSVSGSDINSPSKVSSLASFLIGRAAGNLEIANYLYWYLKVELQDPTHGAKYKEVFAALKARLSETPFRLAGSYPKNSYVDKTTRSIEGDGSKESKSSSFKSIVNSVSSKLGSSLRVTDSPTAAGEKDAQPRTFWDILESQDQFISGLMDIQMRCREARGKKDAKEAQVRCRIVICRLKEQCGGTNRFLSLVYYSSNF